MPSIKRELALQSPRWLSVAQVAAETGWSRVQAGQHLNRLYDDGHPWVINIAFGGKRRLQIERSALERSRPDAEVLRVLKTEGLEAARATRKAMRAGAGCG